jgi:glycosyltransferase involved in cell wall biosynthesis
MKLIYISQGNIPSMWAHSLQTIKMAQAFGELVADFELVSRGSLQAVFGGGPIDVHDWYGIRNSFCVKYLPVYRRRHEVSDNGEYYPRFFRAAVAYARLQRSAVVYTREFHVASMCLKLGIRTLLETHNCDEHSRFHYVRDRLVDRKLLGIVTIADTIKKCFVKYEMPADRILVWPDAVDLAAFESPPSKEQARDELGIDRDKFLSLYVGHLYPYKGAHYMVEAARSLPDRLLLLVGGWPKDRTPLQEAAADLDNVKFIDHVPNTRVPLYLAAADALLLPNSLRMQPAQARITSPLKLFEYMAARRPVIASDIPAFEGLLEDGINACLVEPDSPGAIVRAIGELAAEPGKAQRLTAAAWERVQEYTWQKRARCILERFLPEMIGRN